MLVHQDCHLLGKKTLNEVQCTRLREVEYRIRQLYSGSAWREPITQDLVRANTPTVTNVQTKEIREPNGIIGIALYCERAPQLLAERFVGLRRIRRSQNVLNSTTVAPKISN